MLGYRKHLQYKRNGKPKEKGRKGGQREKEIFFSDSRAKVKAGILNTECQDSMIFPLERLAQGKLTVCYPCGPEPNETE